MNTLAYLLTYYAEDNVVKKQSSPSDDLDTSHLSQWDRLPHTYSSVINISHSNVIHKLTIFSVDITLSDSDK